MIKNSLLKGKVDSNDDENAEVVLIKKPTNENVSDDENAPVGNTNSFESAESLNNKNTKPVENFATALLSKFELPSFLEWPQTEQVHG